MIEHIENGNRYLTVSPDEYRAMPVDKQARAAVITVVCSNGERITVKNKWGAQAALPAGAK
jgi:hypothetical protein